MNIRPLFVLSVGVFAVTAGFALLAALLNLFFGVRTDPATMESLGTVVAISEATAILLIVLAATSKTLSLDKD